MAGSLFAIDQDNVQKGNGGMVYGGTTRSSADAIFDSSGWSVATGGSKSSASSEKSAGLDLSPWLIGGVVALLVVGWIRTAKR